MNNDNQTGYLLSPQQRYLWSLSGCGHNFVSQIVIKIEGKFSDSYFIRNCELLIQCHEVLRTRIMCLGKVNIPLQYIDCDSAVVSNTHDFSEFDHASTEEMIQEIALQECINVHAEQFAAILRLKIIKASNNTNFIIMSISSLFADVPSMKLIVDQAFAFYQKGEITVDMKNLLQYADYSSWQTDAIESAEYTVEQSFWINDSTYITNSQAIINSSSNDASSSVSISTHSIPIQLDNNMSTKIREFSSNNDISIETVFLSIWLYLLSRYSVRDTALVGVFCDGRTHLNMTDAIGHFSKYVPLKSYISDNPTTVEWMKEIDRKLTTGRKFQDYYEPMKLINDNSNIVCFPYCFEYIDNGDEKDLKNLKYSVHKQLFYLSSMQLNLSITVSGAKHSVQLKYGDVDREHVLRLSTQYYNLLSNALNNPNQSVNSLSLINNTDIRELTNRLRNKADLPKSCFVDAFQANLSQFLQYVAVESEGKEWTYAELESRSNQVAHCIIGNGILQYEPVVISMRRSFEFMAAVLGVMKAGAVFVPIDTFAPRRHIERIINDLKPKLSIYGDDVTSRLPSGNTKIIQIDTKTLDQFPDVKILQINRSLDDCAYIMYTSGTTGVPKGVKVSQLGLMNYLNWAVEKYMSSDGDGALVHTSIGFDLTLTGIFLPILVGQRIVFVPETYSMNAIVEMLGKGRRFSLLKLTPSHLKTFSQILSYKGGGQLQVQSLVIGGEALLGTSLPWIRQNFPHARIYNEYGPTETVVGATCFEVPKDAFYPSGVPIGKPISNNFAYVVDTNIAPVPIGMPGELYIGGIGVSSGYYKREDLTEEKFIQNPFSHKKGRLYRTGDIVRMLPSGDLEYLGRSDRQIKIRGFRIELDEIEALLTEHNFVEQAVVLHDANENEGTNLLTAFLRIKTDITESNRPTRDDLHEFLKDRLPQAALPANYHLIEEVPLTLQGKVDEKSLREQGTVALKQNKFVPPSNDNEEVLVGIWQNVLNCVQVGIDDDYFALGGDSIRSIRITGEAQRRGLNISVADVHKYTTIRKIVKAIEEQRTVKNDVPKTQPFSLISNEDKEKLPHDAVDAYPLNLLQEGMIYHRAFSPKSAVYHAILGLQIRAPFNLTVMKQVIQELVNRHPLLRTSFDLDHYSLPLQIVYPTVKDPLSYCDLRDLASDQHRTAIEAWMSEEKRKGFNIHDFPLIRFMVHQLTDNEFHINFSYHHEIIDGWSEATMVSQVLNHYLSLMHGEEFKIEEPQATFRDSIMLEQQTLKSDEFRGFWSEYLKNPTLLRLPRLISGPKADKGDREIVKLPVPISKGLSNKVKQLAIELAVPVKTIMLCAHMFVLRQYGGYSDLLTHMVSNGRPENSDGQDVIGLFVNSFTFRLKLNKGTWAEMITNTLLEEQESIPYRRYPMAELKRHQGSDPLSETLFFLTNYHVYHKLEKWENCELLDINLYGESTFPYCAICKINPVTQRLQMRIEYDILQFAPELIHSMSDCYIKVLEEMVSDPHGKFHNKSLLSSKETQDIVKDRNYSVLPEQPGTLVHEWIESIAKENPHSTALLYQDDLMSYDELNHRANLLAHYLINKGVFLDTRVGICLNRSPNLIVAILAVLKAGGAYVPFDPSHKDERKFDIISQADIQYLIIEENTKQEFQLYEGNRILIDSHWQTISTGRASNPGLQIDSRNLAYLIYTSGSTGKPKGVLVTHGNLAYSTNARINYYGDKKSRFLLLPSYSFDSSVAVIFGTLVTGSVLVLPEKDSQFELLDLEKLILEKKVSHILCIPSLYSSMLDSMAEKTLENLDSVIVAGEPCPKEIYERHTQCFPDVDFYNEYGPTEATVWSTVWKGGSSNIMTQIPIGQQIAGTQLYITNDFMQPLPVGVQGELYIGGAGVTCGYNNDPVATAESFLPDPFSRKPGARLYKTNDLCRYLLDRQIEFLGRLDHQVKVRGFRIETGEVEAVINGHENVRRAVVHPKENENGEKILVAYIVPTQEVKNLVDDVRQHVREKLPKYMHPSAYVVLDAIPLTTAGKVDYKTLPKPDSNVLKRRDYVAPRDITEEVLASIWSKVLGQEKVSVMDDFFEIGGESLRAMQVVSTIRKLFGVELPMSNLILAGATIVDLAKYIKGVSRKSMRMKSVDIVGASLEEGVF